MNYSNTMESDESYEDRKKKKDEVVEQIRKEFKELLFLEVGCFGRDHHQNIESKLILEKIEYLVKQLNLKNNDSQQQIRSNKDKENQKIVYTLKKNWKSLLQNDHGISTNEFTPYGYAQNALENVIKEATGKDIKDL